VTSPDLATLTISNFRSVGGTVAIPLNAPVVLIHGANGAGKSSVMSALELALTGNVSGVDPTDREHLVHRGARRGEITLVTSTEGVDMVVDGPRAVGSPLLDRTPPAFSSSVASSSSERLAGCWRFTRTDRRATGPR